MAGPLHGYRIIELAGIGPGPFAAMLMADMGAEVIRVERSQAVVDGGPTNLDILQRGRRSIAIDLKNPEGVNTLLRLIDGADALCEGFRPGVTERLGIGPDVCLARNPKLVYGRMTGWGQHGPYAHAAGHDINYIALSGVLAHIGRKDEAPLPPLNLIGDFGGGGMFLAFGVVCALLEAQKSGNGQVVDAAMVDGAAVLMSMFYGFRAMGTWNEDVRGEFFLDTGAPFYDVYRTADDRYVSLGSIERQFYAELLRRTGLDSDPDFAEQNNKANWPRMKVRLAEVIGSRTSAQWCAEMEMSDACFAPVLTIGEAFAHPHNVARNAIVDIDGVLQPAPAPRLSRTPGEIGMAPARPGENTRDVLAAWGFDASEIDHLTATGAVRQAN